MKNSLGRIQRALATLLVVALSSDASTETTAQMAEDVATLPAPAETREVTIEATKPGIAEKDPVLPVRMPNSGNKENLFSGHSWYAPPPPPPTRKSAPVRREPSAPPLPYKLLGTYEQGDSGTLFLLVKGDRVYDVTIGDTLDDTYRVDGVTNNQLMLTYLPLNTSQGLRLGDKK